MAELVGAVLGMALFGAIMAWIVRYVFRRMPLFWSYAIGLAIFVWPAAASWTYNHPGTLFAESFLIYGFAGVLAFPVLVSTSLMGKAKDERTEDRRSGSRRQVFRFIGWIVFSILVALGATCIFAALKGTGPDASLPFFVGALCLIGAFFIWRALSRIVNSQSVRRSSSNHEEIL